MCTREAVERLPENIREKIEEYRKDYKSAMLKRHEDRWATESEVIRSEVWGYIKALKDAGVITELQRRILTVYSTVYMRDENPHRR